jgi:ABC-type lipopolysaccharide export system ATPase subunit
MGIMKELVVLLDFYAGLNPKKLKTVKQILRSLGNSSLYILNTNEIVENNVLKVF